MMTPLPLHEQLLDMLAVALALAAPAAFPDPESTLLNLPVLSFPPPCSEPYRELHTNMRSPSCWFLAKNNGYEKRGTHSAR